MFSHGTGQSTTVVGYDQTFLLTWNLNTVTIILGSIKQGIVHLDVNVTESAVTRIAKAEKPAREVFGKIDKSLQRPVRSGKGV